MTWPPPALSRAVGGVIAATRLLMLAAFVSMIALTLVQVANRFAIGLPIFWTEEVIVLLLVWSVMLGLPVQLWQREEILVDVLPLASPVAQRAKLALAGALSIGFCLILLYAGWRYAQRGATVSSPALGLSRFWFFLPIPLCAGLAALALLLRPAEAAGEANGGAAALGLDT